MPACSEGTLSWVEPEQLAELDIIETTAPVLPLLIEDQQRDPAGLRPVHLGITAYEPMGCCIGSSGRVEHAQVGRAG